MPANTTATKSKSVKKVKKEDSKPKADKPKADKPKPAKPKAATLKPKPQKQKKTKKPKKEEFKIMTLEEIEELFEQKTEAFNERMKRHQEQKQQPITMKLIIKYGVADYSKTEKFINESTKAEFNETISSRLSRMMSTADESKVDFNPSEEADDEEGSGPEDDEAFLVKERSRIDEAVKMCEHQFVKGKDLKVEPAVVKKLGVGLAAAVNLKLSESRKLYLQDLSDDSNFYDDESDTSEKRRFPDLVSESKMEDYYDEEEEPEDEEEEENSS